MANFVLQPSLANAKRAEIDIVLTVFRAPPTENAIAKHIPIYLLETVQQRLRVLGKLEGKVYRIAYRGKRSGKSRAYTRKGDANGFSVYVDRTRKS